MLTLRGSVSLAWPVAEKACALVKTVFIAFLYLGEDAGIGCCGMHAPRRCCATATGVAEMTVRIITT